MHIGKKIKEVFENSKMKNKAFAADIHTASRNIYYIFERDNIETQLLMAISKTLKYDFFKLYSNELIENGLIEEPAAEYRVEKKRKVFVEIELTENEYKNLLTKQSK